MGLKEIALELLQKYEEAEEMVICEYSGKINDDLNDLGEKVERYKKQIEEAEPERLTDDDFETIRIHLNAYKEKLCNQRRWKEAEEYQRIIDRFMAFASAEPKLDQITPSEQGESDKLGVKSGKTCTDTINRQAAIDEIRKCRFVVDAIEKITMLPSAQPEQPTEIQDILAYLDEEVHPIVSPDNWNVYSELHDMISKLSAEPERKTGKWIIKKELVPLPWDSGPLNWDNYDEDTHSEWKEYYHCSNCDWKSGEFKGGNFCPNCGADMRGDSE